MMKYMPYLLIVILMITLIFACGRCKKNTHLDITISQDGLKIAFDLIFDIFGNIDFDDSIAPNSAKFAFADCQLNDEEIVDRRQYREGYIAAMKTGILNISVEYFVNSLQKKNENIEDYYPGCVLQIIRKGSPYYDTGASNAAEKVALFKKQLWDDVTKTWWKYYKDDVNIYFNHGKVVPPNELKKRIEETPYLQAIIFLQDKLKNTPLVHVSPCPEVLEIVPKPKTDIDK